MNKYGGIACSNPWVYLQSFLEHALGVFYIVVRCGMVMNDICYRYGRPTAAISVLLRPLKDLDRFVWLDERSDYSICKSMPLLWPTLPPNLEELELLAGDKSLVITA